VTDWNIDSPTSAHDRRRARRPRCPLALATYDPVRFLAADHYGGFVVGIVVVITGFAFCGTRRSNS
jgi:hypothetical protein